MKAMNNINTPQEIIEVVTAFTQKRAIEYRKRTVYDEIWVPCSNPVWNFQEYEYRIAPFPQEFWINIYPNTKVFFESLEDAKTHIAEHFIRTIHVIEVPS